MCWRAISVSQGRSLCKGPWESRVDQGSQYLFTRDTGMQETLEELFPQDTILVVSFESLCARYNTSIISE